MNDTTINYIVAGVPFSVTGDPALEHPFMKDFRDDSSSKRDLTVTISDDISSAPFFSESPVFSSHTFEIIKSGSVFRIIAKESSHGHFGDYDSLTDTGVIFYSKEPLSEPSSDEYSVSEYIFHILKIFFFYFCQKKDMLPLHSSSVIYDGCAYLFSAPSGTGKSTHTAFWQKLFSCEILNGDINMLSVSDETIYAHGMPWCGTSGLYLNRSVPLGNIVFLERAASNEISKCDQFNAVIALSARSFAPNWDKEQVSMTLKTAKKIATLRQCLKLKCLPNPEAAILVKEYIDASKKQA